MTPMKRSIVIISSVVVVVAILAVVAFFSIPSLTSHSSSTTTQTGHPQTFSEGQVFITTGIVAFSSAGSQYYQLETSVRSVTQSLITSIRATVNVSNTGPPVVVTVFFVGVTPLSGFPLGYNVTANAETTDLTPPTSAGFQIGQSLPEAVSVTFQNGTSIQYHVTAQVFSSPV
jgi:hypothetical protein